MTHTVCVSERGLMHHKSLLDYDRNTHTIDFDHDGIAELKKIVRDLLNSCAGVLLRLWLPRLPR